MARQTYSAETVVRGGLTATQRDGHADGHGVAFPSAGALILGIENTGAGEHTVTVQTPTTTDGLAVADRTLAVPAGERRFMGPFPKNVYEQDDGALYVDFDASPTEVKVEYMHVPFA